MPLRQIEILADPSFDDGVAGIAGKYDALDYYCGAVGADGRRRHVVLMGRGDRQGLLDALQGLLGKSETARIVVTAVEALIPPEPPEEESDDARAQQQQQVREATREELYENVAQGADLGGSYVLQVVLSTIVAAIGLLENSVAVVIGAMVLAPLLGPNLAFSFGAALGDGKLMLRAMTTGLAGLGIAMLIGGLIGASHVFAITAPELLSRTEVGFDGVALALASGAAAVLSITTGLPSALVGVMVAVALMPPTVTAGIMAGAGQPYMATGALLLLIVNVVCVNLAALVVFLIRGIKPRTWHERKAARQSSVVAGLVWLAMLAVLATIILLRQPVK